MDNTYIIAWSIIGALLFTAGVLSGRFAGKVKEERILTVNGIRIETYNLVRGGSYVLKVPTDHEMFRDDNAVHALLETLAWFSVDKGFSVVMIPQEFTFADAVEDE